MTQERKITITLGDTLQVKSEDCNLVDRIGMLTVAEMKDFEQKVNTGEWSYSFMVETLCKMADSYRTQPQEGMEEVECTHPYKECVMSDRVNKYGTPLTKCSVCGNDNICDEE